jgi:hypothetical protein
MRREASAARSPGASQPGMPPLPPGLPPDAMKHAASLWTFLDELAADPQARRRSALVRAWRLAP